MILLQDAANRVGSGWAEARATVEAYIRAHRIGNESLVAELVEEILERAAKRSGSEPDLAPRQLGMEEAIAEVAGRERLLDETPGGRREIPPAPSSWPGELLRDSPMIAEPDAEGLTMKAQPLELNAIGNGAASLWESMDRRPIVGRMVAVALLGLVAVGLWFIFF